VVATYLSITLCARLVGEAQSIGVNTSRQSTRDAGRGSEGLWEVRRLALWVENDAAGVAGAVFEGLSLAADIRWRISERVTFRMHKSLPVCDHFYSSSIYVLGLQCR
jgi:hypothetical protein